MSKKNPTLPAKVDVNKEMAARLSEAERRRALRKANTYGVYVLRVGEEMFSLPFYSPSDEAAILAYKDFAHQFGMEQKTDLYKIGDYFGLEGRVVPHTRKLIVER